MNIVQTFLRVRELRTLVRAWLATYHCLYGDQYRVPRTGDAVLVLDMMACPMYGLFSTPDKYGNIREDLAQRLAQVGARYEIGAVAWELNLYDTP